MNKILMEQAVADRSHSREGFEPRSFSENTSYFLQTALSTKIVYDHSKGDL